MHPILDLVFTCERRRYSPLRPGGIQRWRHGCPDPLYEDATTTATPDGDFVRGREAIRQQWEGFVALGGTITVVTRHAVEVGDLALLSNGWHFTGAGMELSSRTSEVTRRQSDGTWQYVVDHPYAGADALSEQSAGGCMGPPKYRHRPRPVRGCANAP